MKLVWEDIPIAVRTRLETELAKTDVGSFETQWLYSLLKGCKLLKYRWSGQKDIRDAILSAFTHTFGHVEEDSLKDFLICIYHLSGTGLNWKDLPTEVTETIFNGIKRKCDHFVSHRVSNLLRK
jgi:uncharacterized Fe-S cluster-containing MiaB family protein